MPNRSLTMSPAILLVPVDPPPPCALLDALAARLERAFGRPVRVTDPLRAPAAAQLAPNCLAADPVRAAIAATWGCGCRDRLVGVTAAAIEGGDAIYACGGVLVLTAAPGAEGGAAVRAVGRSLGLEDCADPGCAMHPGGDGSLLCRTCRARC
jgi:hypothetical protein